ncbi:MAG TPA: hypothetical protein DCE42_05230 [Myxococcales bacterium]|nr:hypothetical protein [Deltaproteobacteria bacterium]MBK07350.1 hypothetical protein [Deltaproteobacteria bacterium]MBU53525.1 hypothetical protein [Deltaproteobacteria bacterium]HAA54134.1 hypothetical protein [Myxococcales bacterium]|tara:strand:- start:8239 stop:8715 length:477 start_codon:yes stop_codon:yes gene_type:complete
MKQQDLLECREDMLDEFEDFEQEIEYHEVILDGPTFGGSTINANFGFVEETNDSEHPKTQMWRIPFFIRQKPHKAKRIPKVGDEFEGEYDVRVNLPTQALIEQGITINRDNGFFRLETGEEYRIEAVQGLPKTNTSSIITCCWCSLRKPQEDNPGHYG